MEDLMPPISSYDSNEYLSKAEHLPQPYSSLSLTIDYVQDQEVEDKFKGTTVVKPAVHWIGGEYPPWLVGPTMLRQIAGVASLHMDALSAGNTDNWHGLTVEVWHDPGVQAKGNYVGGLRARAPQLPPHQQPQTQQPPQAPPQQPGYPAQPVQPPEAYQPQPPQYPPPTVPPSPAPPAHPTPAHPTPQPVTEWYGGQPTGHHPPAQQPQQPQPQQPDYSQGDDDDAFEPF